MCKRGHPDWFLVQRFTKRGKLKKNKTCSYLLGYRQQETTALASTIECGSLPIRAKLPIGYLAMAEITL